MATENGGRDQEERDQQQNRSLLNDFLEFRTNADEGREPELFSARMGTRMYSVAALLERVISAFMDEHSGGTAALREADTETKRIKLLKGTVDYVLAVESINMSNRDKADLMRRAYAELFTYGPLDDLFEDEQITTIVLEGQDKVAVRYGHGDLVRLDPIFDDKDHMRKIIARLLIDSGAQLRPDIPLIEAGVWVKGRPVCVNVAGPPVSPSLSADIRVHPADPPTLEAMVAAGFMTAQAAELLVALAASSHGIVIVGDTESGKTSLLSALSMHIPPKQKKSMIAVERAGELHLPGRTECFVVQWPNSEQEAITFGEQIGAALERSPTCILLDEVRTDEAPAIAPLLANDDVPRQMWTFRGPADRTRLSSALGMLARRSDPSQSEAQVRALYRRLPFIVTVRRRSGNIQLHSISEWQYRSDVDYPGFVDLMTTNDETIQMTGKYPAHELELPDEFWM